MKGQFTVTEMPPHVGECGTDAHVACFYWALTAVAFIPEKGSIVHCTEHFKANATCA